MACSSCKSDTACTCTLGTTVVVEENKNCLGVEDLCFGEGVMVQNRNGCRTSITKINCSNIPCTDGKSVGTHITEIEEDLNKIQPYRHCTNDTHRVHLHHGEWADNLIDANVQSCAIGLPGVVSQRVPINTGDTVMHNGKLWESCVDGNVSEPSDTNNTFTQVCSADATQDKYLKSAVISNDRTKYVLTMADGTKFNLPIDVASDNYLDKAEVATDGSKYILTMKDGTIHNLPISNSNDKYLEKATLNADTTEYTYELNDGTKITVPNRHISVWSMNSSGTGTLQIGNKGLSNDAASCKGTYHQVTHIYIPKTGVWYIDHGVHVKAHKDSKGDGIKVKVMINGTDTLYEVYDQHFNHDNLVTLLGEAITSHNSKIHGLNAGDILTLWVAMCSNCSPTTFEVVGGWSTYLQAIYTGDRS